MEKARRIAGATDDELEHAHFTLTIYSYKHFGICNIYFFSTTKMVARTRLNVTSYVHCLSFCWFRIIL